jgi:hypothetical protein
MRCVVVNGAKLKSEASCAHCGGKIGEAYVREMGSRLIYCDFRCYSVAVETAVKVLGYRTPAFGAWTRSS